MEQPPEPGQAIAPLDEPVSVHGLSPSLEMYLKAIYLLCGDDRAARVGEIAQALRVSMPSVSGAVQKLGERGLIRHRRYRGVALTEKGRSIAAELTQKWELLARFFSEVLAVDPNVARADACRMEHVVSAETLAQLLRFVEFSDKCSQVRGHWLRNFAHYARTGTVAEPCPGCDEDCSLEVSSRAAGPEVIPLSLLRPGQQGRIVRVRGNGAVQRRIRDLGMVPGTQVTMVRAAPLGDPIEVRARKFKLSLRKEEAAEVLVEAIR